MTVAQVAERAGVDAAWPSACDLLLTSPFHAAEARRGYGYAKMPVLYGRPNRRAAAISPCPRRRGRRRSEGT